MIFLQNKSISNKYIGVCVLTQFENILGHWMQDFTEFRRKVLLLFMVLKILLLLTQFRKRVFQLAEFRTRACLPAEFRKRVFSWQSLEEGPVCWQSLEEGPVCWQSLEEWFQDINNALGYCVLARANGQTVHLKQNVLKH